MKLHAALCFLVFAGCATSSQNMAKAEQAPTAHAVESHPAEPVRLETTAGTFLVNPAQAEDFQKVLAGESTPKSFYAAGVTE